MVIYGDISSNTLNAFTMLINDVFGSLLNNLQNQKSWPNLLAKEISEKFYAVLENVAVVKGNQTKRTFLPLPMNVEKCSETVEQIVLG